MLEELKEEVAKANKDLDRYHLITMTWGNVSAIDREKNLVVIKPSGVSYEKMTADDMVVLDLTTGKTVEGKLSPSSDAPTHLELYRSFPDIGAVVHTHSPFATSFAQAKEPIPALGTTHADHFYGEIPVTRDMTDAEIRDAYEENTGKVIIETFQKRGIDPNEVPAVLVAEHGVFNWGKNATKAVENALVTERVAEMAIYAGVIRTSKGIVKPMEPMNPALLEKHYKRKHGPNAYYGQKEENK